MVKAMWVIGYGGNLIIPGRYWCEWIASCYGVCELSVDGRSATVQSLMLAGF